MLHLCKIPKVKHLGVTLYFPRREVRAGGETKGSPLFSEMQSKASRAHGLVSWVMSFVTSSASRHRAKSCLVIYLCSSSSSRTWVFYWKCICEFTLGRIQSIRRPPPRPIDNQAPCSFPSTRHGANNPSFSLMKANPINCFSLSDGLDCHRLHPESSH